MLMVFFCGTSSGVRSKKEAQYTFDETAFDCDRTTVRQIKTFKTPCNTRISVLKNIKGKRFIVKQKQQKPLRWYMGVAREKLGFEVALAGDVSVNSVDIIPDRDIFPGKYDDKVPATFHEVVPGTKVTYLPKKLKWLKVYIQQPMKVSVDQRSWGLTRPVIANMALHPDLPRIVAFDTFIANADRHRGNFFYDKKSNRFYAIDLESSFNKELAIYACDLIAWMINNNNEELSAQELVGLRVYRDVLKKLVKKYSPEILYEKLLEFAIQGGILEKISKSHLFLITRTCKQRIKKNYGACEDLVDLLDTFIKQQSILKKTKPVHLSPHEENNL